MSLIFLAEFSKWQPRYDRPTNHRERGTRTVIMFTRTWVYSSKAQQLVLPRKLQSIWKLSAIFWESKRGENKAENAQNVRRMSALSFRLQLFHLDRIVLTNIYSEDNKETDEMRHQLTKYANMYSELISQLLASEVFCAVYLSKSIKEWTLTDTSFNNSR